jgi:hypothetical protein
MKAAQHRAFRDLLERDIAAAHNENTAAQGFAAWTALMKSSEMPRTKEQVTDAFMNRCADWFSERVDEEGPAFGLPCDVVVHQHFAAAELALAIGS